MAVWYSLADQVLSRLDAEAAHGLALRTLKSGLLPGDSKPDPASLSTAVWGRPIPNPIGLAAGFDKNAEVPDALLGLGFGFVEIGSVTPRPQPGNPRPRLFRLSEDRGVINRMGFPGQGLDAARARLAARPRRGFVGVNVGANKDSTDRAADYVACSVALAPYADYLVCNMSSPNTPGLRNLPLSRPPTLRSTRREESGGLSGAPLMTLSTDVLRRTARRAESQFPLIGCGGVGSGADAYAKIRAGASLVQLYSAMVYEGPPLIRRIKDELAALLARDGFASVTEAVGADLR
ncbi:MAG: dihydroorotate dehydrogenase 2 [Rhodospirillales bacterium]|nr:dihydroorotate dehydrogenase 2 [Rhodospirillales bacterium]